VSPRPISGHAQRRIQAGLAAAAAGLLLAGCADLPLWMLLQRHSAIGDYRHFDNATVRKSDRVSPLPVVREPALALPDQVDGEPFEAALAHNETVAFVVVQGGRIVLERYFDGYDRDSVATSFSVAKSFVSALLGIAISEGKIGGVDDPVTRYLPELAQSDPRFAEVSLRHLLEMRSSLAFDEGYNSPISDASRFYLHRDLHPLVRKLALRDAPDRRYEYVSGNTQLLGMVIERATGTTLAQYLEEKIWQPMGAEFDASWSLDSRDSGVAKAFCCLNARAVDYARFGEVFLHRGRWNDRQVVPEAWVAASTEVREHPGADLAAQWNVEGLGSARAAFYAWQWRRVSVSAPQAPLAIAPADGFFAQGLHGQFIYVAPAADMVIVRLGKETGRIRWPALLARIAAMNATASHRAAAR
jgi:CubicO group peptidase (beta-lactamase class C family)